MDIRGKMKPAFASTEGGLFSKVTKADVGGGYLQLGERGVALMAWADPFFPDPSLPPHVEKVLIESILTGFPSHYTQPIGNDDLRRELSEGRLRSFNKLDVDPFRNVLITPGSDSGLFYAMLPFVEPGVDVMVLDPSYPNNFQNVKLMGGNVIHVPLRPENNFQPQIEDFISLATPSTKVVVLTNPNNPTTTVLRREFLEELARFAIERDLVCIVDQAFEDSVFDGIEFVTLAALPGMFERTLTVCSISKGMGLSGLRVGYIVGDERAMDVLYGAMVSVLGATNTSSQIAATAALQNDAFIAEYTAIFERRRHMVYDALNSVPGVDMRLPEAGFFGWANVASLGGGERAASYLMENMVAAVNAGTAYGEQGKDYIRLIFGSMGSDEQLRQALERIAAALCELAKSGG